MLQEERPVQSEPPQVQEQSSSPRPNSKAGPSVDSAPVTSAPKAPPITSPPLSPTPLLGSNRLGANSGWSSTFESEPTDTTESGHQEEKKASPVDELKPLKSPRRVKSFKSMLKDYTVQGPRSFGAPLYEESEVRSMPQMVNILDYHIQTRCRWCSKQSVSVVKGQCPPFGRRISCGVEQWPV